MKRKPSVGLRLFWVIGFGILIFRIAYDVRVYFFGGTVAVRQASPYSYDYFLHFPKGYSDFAEPSPLIIFLHGAGEAGKDIRELNGLNPFRDVRHHVSTEDFPYLVACPVTTFRGWDSEQIVAFLDELLEDTRFRYRIDPKRIYLTGISMGGYGTFQVAMDYPDRFTGIIPLAGGCDLKQADQLLSVPVWAFHGEEDDVIRYENSQEFMAELQRLGHPNSHFTLLPGCGHGITETVYLRSEIYHWMQDCTDKK